MITSRPLLNMKLRNHKTDKLKWKISVDAQLLNLATQEMKIEKRLLDKMDKMEEENSKNMGKLNTSMKKLTDSITDGIYDDSPYPNSTSCNTKSEHFSSTLHPSAKSPC